MSKTAIIIPCYNEANRLLIDDFTNFISASQPNLLLCFANDGSRDNTIEQLEKMQKMAPEKVLIVDFEQNSGKAEAIRKTMIQLLTDPEIELLGFFDADLATPLDEVSDFMEIFHTNQTIQLVIGSRIKRLGATITRKAKRHYAGRIFATLASVLLQLDVYDTQCGAKMIRRELADQIMKEPFISSWLFDIEIMARIKQTQYNPNEIIYELPLKKWQDIDGSKLRFRHLLGVPFDLFKIYRRYLR